MGQLLDKGALAKNARMATYPKNTAHPIERPRGFPQPNNGRIVAFVIGIENYQGRPVAELSKVDFAKADAHAFLEAIQNIYTGHAFEPTIFVDKDATKEDITYHLKQSIKSLEENDLFIFYYAGHGFHGIGGNRITVWESHPHYIEETTLLLRDILFDPLSATNCRRTLTFVDACSSKFAATATSRIVISSLDHSEFSGVLNLAEYRALFISCSPGEQSFPCKELKHGIWTYFLLQALRGNTVEALDQQGYLTDVSLRDFLAKVVPKYIADNAVTQAKQRPYAMINASKTFAIHYVPTSGKTLTAEGDMMNITATPLLEHKTDTLMHLALSTFGVSLDADTDTPVCVSIYLTSDAPDRLRQQLLSIPQLVQRAILVNEAVKQRALHATLQQLIEDPCTKTIVLQALATISFSAYLYYCPKVEFDKLSREEKVHKLFVVPLTHRLSKKGERFEQVHTQIVGVTSFLNRATEVIFSAYHRKTKLPQVKNSKYKSLEELAALIAQVSAIHLSAPENADIANLFEGLRTRIRYAENVATGEKHLRDINPLT